MKTVDFSERNVDAFLHRMYRKKKSLQTKRFYKAGVDKLREFCELKGIQINKRNVIDVLDRYVDWLDTEGKLLKDGKRTGLKAKSVVDYFSGAKRFIVANDIPLNNDKLRNKVVLPGVTLIDEEPMRADTARRLLTAGRPGPYMRALILVMWTGGMRLAEALQMAVGDVDFKTTPVKVTLRQEITKNGRKRITFITDEAAAALKEVIPSGTSKERLLFDISKGDILARSKWAEAAFGRVRRRAGLNDLVPNHRVHQVHLHNMRKFWLTKGSDVMGFAAAHAIAGHGLYMDTYYSKTEDERMADYVKFIPHLEVLTHEASKAEQMERSRRETLLAIGIDKKVVEGIPMLGQMSTSEFAALIETKREEGDTAPTVFEQLKETQKQLAALQREVERMKQE
ncbi:MAG: tyrosine-type recombinase/integrase [Nitrososphaerota archaeon]|nr:tyrosine-type recombinase/integrase [Nitrososphaerota archaeon]